MSGVGGFHGYAAEGWDGEGAEDSVAREIPRLNEFAVSAGRCLRDPCSSGFVVSDRAGHAQGRASPDRGAGGVLNEGNWCILNADQDATMEVLVHLQLDKKYPGRRGFAYVPDSGSCPGEGAEGRSVSESGGSQMRRYPLVEALAFGWLFGVTGLFFMSSGQTPRKRAAHIAGIGRIAWHVSTLCSATCGPNKTGARAALTGDMGPAPRRWS